MTDPKSQTTQYGWCACGSMINLTDPKQNTTSWTYDLEGRVVKKTYPDTSSYTYQYDPAVSLLTQMTDAKKQETQYFYDVDNKLTVVDYFNAQNTTAPVQYQYDLVLGRLTTMLDGTGTTSYTYGTIGQVGGNLIKAISQPVGTTKANITYTYDNDSRVITRSIDGVQENYGFNGVGQLTQIGNPLGNFGYTYDPNSARLVNVGYPNGQSVTMDYFTAADTNGASGSLKDITNMGGGSTSGQTLSKFSYAYNPTGEIKTWQQQLDNNTADAKTYGMGYDPDSELQGVTLTSGTSGFDGLTANQFVTYGYDAAGNRTTEQTPNFLHTFGTNNLNQLTNETANPISVVGSTNRQATVLVNATPVPENASNQFQTNILPQGSSQTPLTILAVAPDGTVASQKNHVLNTTPFQYDANGNLTQDQYKKYQWDAANRLISVTYLNPQPVSVTDNITFQYDGSGRRVAITEKHGNTILNAGANDWRFVWRGENLCEQRNSAGTTVIKRFFGFGEQVVSGSANYYFSIDHLGSVREMVDGSGAVTARYDYDPWGRQSKPTTIGTLDADFGHTGFYQERAAGLDLTLYRAYDPEKGRWLSRDPIDQFKSYKYGASVKSDPDLYKYVKNDPLIFVDPLGLVSCKGQWRTVDSEFIGNLVYKQLCICYWLCMPCKGPTIWSGNRNDLPHTYGGEVFNGSGDASNPSFCVCPKPGPETGCDCGN